MVPQRAEQSGETLSRTSSRALTAQELRWAAARGAFHVYVGLCLLTVVGGFLTAPLMTWLIYGDWRFWRHWNSAVKLWPHGYKMAFYMLQGRSGFMLDVPLTSAPSTTPDPGLVNLAPTWEHGGSCGPCSRCCETIACPVLEEETGLCRGYDSFFWRYFNCGRFPSAQREIDFYGCPKWEMKSPARSSSGRVA